MGRVYVEVLPLGSSNDVEYEDNGEIEEEDDHEEEDDDDDDFKGSIFVCRACHAHVVRGSELVSKDFRGRSGKAYLFNTAMNLSAGVPEDRMLITGMHTISDVFCFDCSKPLGWKYLHAFDERQRYKVGKVILEAAYVKRMVDGRPVPSIQRSSSSSSEDS